MSELYKMPDASAWQGTVDMAKVQAAGAKRVGMRGGYGKNNVDKRFAANAEACKSLGMLPPVIYWFSYAYTAEMARKEADYAVQTAAKYYDRCPIAFDWEYDSMDYAEAKGVSTDKSLVTNMAIAFLAEVKAKGYIPVLYASEDYLKNYIDLAKVKATVSGVYVWYARYTSKLPKSRQDVDIWQYTSSGSISGVSGKVDMNKVYTDFGEDNAETEYYPVYTGTSESIVTALEAVGETDTTFAHRKEIAAANGISNYKGTAAQNTTMVKMLKAGTLKKARKINAEIAEVRAARKAGK